MQVTGKFFVPIYELASYLYHITSHHIHRYSHSFGHGQTVLNTTLREKVEQKKDQTITIGHKNFVRVRVHNTGNPGVTVAFFDGDKSVKFSGLSDFRHRPNFYEKLDAKFNADGQLAFAASCLAFEDVEDWDARHEAPQGWSLELWQKMIDKPHKERLIISGAFAAAELDRQSYNEHLEAWAKQKSTP